MADADVESIVTQVHAQLEDARYVDCEEEIARHSACAEALRAALAELLEGLRQLKALPPGIWVYPPVLGGHRLGARLGIGGEGGGVFRAVDEATKREVALKILPQGLDERRVQRFRVQMQSAALLDHEHVVRVFGAGEDQGFWYIAMERLAGGSLAEFLEFLRDARRPAPPPGVMARYCAHGSDSGLIESASYQRAAAAALAGIADALHAAHELDLLHRDVKPSNILLSEDGTAKLADFGLARRLADARRTRTEETPGTRPYMAPQQLNRAAGPVDHRTDVYALGATLYETTTLHLPHDASNEAELMQAILRDDPRDPRRYVSGLHPDLAAVTLRCLQKDPEHRYRTALELADELRRFADGLPVATRRTHVAVRVWRRTWRRPRAALGAAGVLVLVATSSAVALYAVEKARRERERGFVEHLAAARVQLDETQKARRQLRYSDIERLSETAARAALDALSRAPTTTHALEAVATLISISMARDDPEAAKRVLSHVERVAGRQWEAAAWLDLRVRVGLQTGEADLRDDALEALGSLIARAEGPEKAALKDKLDIARTLAYRSRLDLGSPCAVDLEHLRFDRVQPIVREGGHVVLWHPVSGSYKPCGTLPAGDSLHRSRTGDWANTFLVWTTSPNGENLHAVLGAGRRVVRFTVSTAGGPPRCVDVVGIPDEPTPFNTDFVLRVLEHDADHRPLRVLAFVRAALNDRSDYEIDFGSLRATPVCAPSACTRDAALVLDGNTTRLIVAQAEWSGFGVGFLTRGRVDWALDRFDRVGMLSSMNVVRGPDGRPTSLLLTKASTYGSRTFFGPRAGNHEWLQGVHLVDLQPGWPPHLVPACQDVDFDPDGNWQLRGAAGVELVRGAPPVHLVECRGPEKAELRVYRSRPSTRGDDWLLLRVGIPALGRRFITCDVDGDGDEELVSRVTDPANHAILVFGAERP